MHKIKKKQVLNSEVTLMEIEAPHVAERIKPGQFVVLRLHEKGERIPLTSYKNDPQRGTITIIFQKVGKTTYELNSYDSGDTILDVIGPLGRPSEIDEFGTVVCVAGGVGCPEIYPIAKALKKAGNKVIIIIGFRTKDLVILEDEAREITDEVYVTTDDGTYGRKAFTTDIVKELIEEGAPIDLVHAVGPPIMMKVLCDITRPHNLKTIVSLCPIMLDATGMCGVCRVRIDGRMKLACVDGPEFDGHKVDFDDLMSRLETFKEEEKEALERYTAKEEL